MKEVNLKPSPGGEGQKVHKYRILDIIKANHKRNRPKIRVGNIAIDPRYFPLPYPSIDKDVIENICKVFNFEIPDTIGDINYKNLSLEYILSRIDPGMFKLRPRIRQYRKSTPKSNTLDTLKEILNPFNNTVTRFGNINDTLELYVDEISIQYTGSGTVVLDGKEIKYESIVIHSNIYDKINWDKDYIKNINTIKVYRVNMDSKEFYMLYTHQPKEYNIMETKGVEYIPCCYVFGKVSISSNFIKGDVPDND